MSYASAHLFPVRHHSPRTSFVLRAMLDRVRPDLVLVEGPEDANELIAAIVDPETVPPVAILAYRTDGTPGSSLWPFASYSPEYVALRWAREHQVAVRFCDISTGQSLARHAIEHDHRDAAGEDTLDVEPTATDDLDEPAPRSMRDEIARERGFRSFEEFWECSFEAPDYDEASFRAALVAYADLIRNEGADVRFHRARDAHMAQRIEQAIAAGSAPDRIVCVLGAAHAAALAVSDVDASLLTALDPSVASTTTLIPYSFPRLAEQTGYGAGNRAPQFYQRAWDSGLSFHRAALEVLIDFCDHLRLRGFMASLADTIEAYRLAAMLADIRGKSAPGLDEVREATIATMCRGEATHVDSFLWPSVIGRNVGKVASRIGKNSLQEEFWREVNQRSLPRTDSPEEFVLKLGDAVQVETSVFLHRLRIADVPYAAYIGTQSAAMRRPDATREDAGGYSALSRVREAWHAQWTPSTDIALIEKIVLGETLEQVCQRILSARLTDARGAADAAEVLLESVVASVQQTISTALATCDRLAASDADLPSLARACRALSGLVAYGTSRTASPKPPSGGLDLAPELAAGARAAAIPQLCVRTFERAVLRVSSACVGNDESVAGSKEALRVLHEIAMGQPIVDKSAWLAAARALGHDYAVNPACSGVAFGLLYLAQEVSDAEISLAVSQRLSDALAPEAAANFLAGFLEVNALVLVKSRPIVQALDAFLQGIDRDRFKDALPVLRRAFAPLGPTERRYLVDNLVALRKLAGAAGEVAAIVAAKDKEVLAAMSDEIAKAMNDLDDLL